ncbi:hypothetical protein HRR78_001182 [Exophiala dermatitidis]|nr:hypothetical protein HRR75_002514 [Exophiala dermatitidis]KAJ4557511.1 hypothetical protein HRR78_001182 [Exophiala dermatitidis]
MSSTLQDPNQSDQPTPPPPSSSASSASSPSRPEKLYQATLKTIPPAMSALLAEYSGIPPQEQKAHITTVRDRAYATHPYPCLGRWRFLELDLADHPLYRSEILPALSSSESGCCLGQDIRKLIHDGADATRLMGADLNPEFIEIGYSLFRDRDRFPWEDHFIAPADVFDFSPSSELSRRCDGRVGILHCTAVFHLFGLDEQKMVARRCLRLVLGSGYGNHASETEKGEGEGRGTTKKALICGGQAGHIRAGEYAREPNKKSRYRHNEQSWRQMWEEVVAEDDGAWKDRVVKVDVHAVMEERTFGDGEGQSWNQNQSSGGAGGVEGRPLDSPTNSVANNTQRQIGSVEDGFRWMKWWAWLEFR